MVNLSIEQQLFVQKGLEGINILVDACIGSGKTTAIQHLCEQYPTKTKVLYLTYNKLLKIDAKSKIRRRNVTVTNYHGYAFSCLKRKGIKTGVSDMIQTFIKCDPLIAKYKVLVIDEYQDIEQELAEMLEMIKAANPGIQIVAVGDMQQKIYDKTTLDVEQFINGFLGDHIKLEFTKCFRLSAAHAAMLGRIWNKRIIGVNPDCRIRYMSEGDVVDYLAQQDAKDVLCLGARTGSLSKTLNKLEERYPERFNKYNVYASISETDSVGATEPNAESAIFTTYDSSKGLERKIAVLFDFTESYWEVRIEKPQQSYEILRNIFCVAASRGKQEIIFVEPGEALLSEKTLSTPVMTNHKFTNMEISEMFDFKFKEDVEECFSLIETRQVEDSDVSIISINNKDGLIDLSPCIGIYQEASYFEGYDIDESIAFHMDIDHDRKYLYNDEVKTSALEEKILFLTSLETQQNRYRKQVEVPFIQEHEKDVLHERLQKVFRRDETVQVACSIPFSDQKSGEFLFSAMGMADVVKDEVVYELKFVSELTHEHFLQCACYVVALGLEKGILWNTRDGHMFEIRIPDESAFLDAVVNTITKHEIRKYHNPSGAATYAHKMVIDKYNERKKK